MNLEADVMRSMWTDTVFNSEGLSLRTVEKNWPFRYIKPKSAESEDSRLVSSVVNPNPNQNPNLNPKLFMSFASIEDAAAEIRDGRMIIIVDDEDRENEGDLVCAAEKITPEVINFMARHARGLICLPLTEERCDELHLTTQVADNTSFLATAFTVSIDGRKGVSTGISASDRATTILTAVDPQTKPSDLARPGHVFPLRAPARPRTSRQQNLASIRALLDLSAGVFARSE